jgi:putative membrane protein
VRILTWLVSTMIAVAVAAWLLPGIRFDGASEPFSAELADKWLPVLIVSVIIGLVNLTVAPVVKFFSFPFIVLTLGLLLLVINALMLMLVGWLAGQLDVGFHVDGFWWAMGGSLLITVVSSLLGASDD